MTRTKWMRLGVRDPADIMRWAAAQNTRHLDEFRYRVIRGREFVSFRLVPRYRVQIGTHDIVVVAHVKPRWHQIAAATVVASWRHLQRRGRDAIAALKPAATAPAPDAVLYQFAAASRLSSPSRR